VNVWQTYGAPFVCLSVPDICYLPRVAQGTSAGDAVGDGFGELGRMVVVAETVNDLSCRLLIQLGTASETCRLPQIRAGLPSHS
jgi:hypothetical protein